MAKDRIPIWLALIVGAFGLPLAAILGLWTYKSVTTPILHPDPQQVRSVTHSDPSRKWTDAVERGRQTSRAGLILQNLPGLSVAVGVDGDIVWAEGFGWANLENQVPVAPDTGFRVADASKALTSAAVGLLLEKNTLHLDEEIQVHARVPEKGVARQTAPADGASGRRSDRPRWRGPSVQRQQWRWKPGSALRADGRRVAAGRLRGA